MKNRTHWRNSNLERSGKQHCEVVYTCSELNKSDRETLWQDVQIDGFTHDIRTAQIEDKV